MTMARHGNGGNNGVKAGSRLMKGKVFLGLLALLSAFPALSTDMYLPAIPLLEQTWHQPLPVVNLTLVCFFISYCICLLVYGPISDRFGRRPPLLAGIGVYVVGSLMCGISGNVVSLIIFRVFQAAGAAGASVLSLAITKDVYRGNMRMQVLAYMGVIMALAPMLAPVIGGWVMAWLSWRWIFAGQALVGLMAFLGVCLMGEPLTQGSATGILQTVRIYVNLLKNRRYLGLTMLVSLLVFPHFAFIGGAADIYITHFKLSEQAFSYFFAGNAAALMAGSFACSHLVRHMKIRTLMAMSFTGILAGGIGLSGHFLTGPLRLGLPMALTSLSFGLSRPLGNNLVLEQVDEHAGAASSLLIFLFFSLGALSMWLISLDWADKIGVIGLFAILSGGTVLGVWSFLPRAITGQ